MAETSPTIPHPVLGELRWEAEHSWWFGQVELSPNKRCDLVVEEDGSDHLGLIEPAAALFPRVLESEPQILRDAVEQRLLKLFNDCWRQEGEAEVTVDELIGKLDSLSTITFGRIHPVKLGYSDGPDEIFGGHCVVLCLDRELRLMRAELQG